MPSAIFYQVESEDKEAVSTLAIRLVAEAVKQRQYLTVLASDKAQAEQIDELLWQAPAESFIPHNLYGEGDDKPAPVEIMSMDELKSGKQIRNRKTVVNLSSQIIENIQTIGSLIDFVPADESQKEQARKRYAHYKKMGCAMSFEKSVN